MDSVDVRKMESRDVGAVAELERLGGEVRWSQAQLAAELDKTISRYYVATTGPATVVGYVGGWVIAPELQVANIVIHPDFRCRGIGRRLLETLLTQAQQEGCTQSTLEVRRSNTHAQALYRAVGYHATGTRPKVYANNEDAILMEKIL